MTKLSTVIIAKNEENNIERCLKSVDWSDEIVLVDTGSDDNTVEIAKKYNAKIFILERWEGFGKAKKFATKQATNDWVLSIDADEQITDELKNHIIRTINNPNKYCYRIKRNSFYLGKLIKHCGWNHDYPKRLFNKKHADFNEKLVHESVKCNGELGTIEEPLLHFTYPTISSHLQKIDFYTDLATVDNKDKKYNVFTAILLGYFKFFKMYFLQSGFLDGKNGLILSILSSFSVFIKYLKFAEKNNHLNKL